MDHFGDGDGDMPIVIAAYYTQRVRSYRQPSGDGEHPRIDWNRSRGHATVYGNGEVIRTWFVGEGYGQDAVTRIRRIDIADRNPVVRRRTLVLSCRVDTRKHQHNGLEQHQGYRQDGCRFLAIHAPTLAHAPALTTVSGCP